MERKRSVVIILIGIILASFVINYLLGQNRYTIKNGDTIAIGPNETTTITNIWEEDSIKNWYIKIKVLAIEERRVKAKVTSPTFFEKDYDKTHLFKTGKSISIIQAEEVTTKIRLEEILTDKAIFSLNIQAGPPAPVLSQQFKVKISPAPK